MNVALIIAITALVLSVWSVIGIIKINQTLNVILDIFKLQKMQNDIKSGKGDPSEMIKELKKIIEK